MPEVKSSFFILTRSKSRKLLGHQYEIYNPEDSAFVNHNFIDEHYLPLHGHKLLAGKNFNSKGKIQ